MANTQRTPAPRQVGSQTQVQASAPSRPTITPTAAPLRQAVLHLRGETGESEEVDGAGDGSEGAARRRIQWAEDVVDNEGLGRKKSKVCCIYHAPKGIDESSDESSSDSDDSHSGDDGSARPAARGRKDCGGLGHNHDHWHEHGHGKGKGRKGSPNAYEKLPKLKGGESKEAK